LPRGQPELHYTQKGKTCLQRDLNTEEPASTERNGAAAKKRAFAKTVSMFFEWPNILNYFNEYGFSKKS
jgi:hypothetical protein